MADLAYYLAGAVAVLAAILKLVRVRRPWSPEVAYLFSELLCIGVAAIVLAPATLRLCARVEPIPNLTRLIGNALTAGAMFCMVGVLICSAHSAEPARRRMRLHTYVLTGTIAAMAVLLVSARTRFTVDFVNAYGTQPLIVAYELVFLAYVTWGLLGVVQLVYQVAGHAVNVFLRVGLRIQVTGAVFGLVWSLWKITITILEATTKLSVPVEGEVSSLLSAVAVLLIALGAATPAWGPVAVHPLTWLRARRRNRRIEPLWSALHAAVPDLELRHPGAGVEFHLYRRVVEIRDSSLVLRVHFHPDAPAWVVEAADESGVRDQNDVAVLVEAANLAAALEAHRVDHRYHADGSTAATPRDLDPDVGVETRWLVQVSDAFARSPIVESVRRRVRQELDATQLSDRESPAV